MGKRHRDSQRRKRKALPQQYTSNGEKERIWRYKKEARGVCVVSDDPRITLPYKEKTGVAWPSNSIASDSVYKGPISIRKSSIREKGWSLWPIIYGKTCATMAIVKEKEKSSRQKKPVRAL